MKTASIDRITVSFHPLHELQIIKRPPFHQLAHLDMLKPHKKSIQNSKPEKNDDKIKLKLKPW